MKELTESYFKEKRYRITATFSGDRKVYTKGSIKATVDADGSLIMLCLGSVILNKIHTVKKFKKLLKLI